MNKLSGSTRGRRPGRPETRAEILAVARRRFLADGYQAVTMRAIAADAGVDAALISYFFGSKKGLSGAALALSANPPEIESPSLAVVRARRCPAVPGGARRCPAVPGGARQQDAWRVLAQDAEAGGVELRRSCCFRGSG